MLFVDQVPRSLNNIQEASLERWELGQSRRKCEGRSDSREMLLP
jgi:hypothetical protein